jgi:hypothetical protein
VILAIYAIDSLRIITIFKIKIKNMKRGKGWKKLLEIVLFNSEEDDIRGINC